MSEYTIRDYDRKLKHISINCNIEKPEEVKTFIANKNVATATKKILCSAYDYFCKHFKIQWTKPKYEPEAKTIKIPTNEKLEILIAKAGKTLSLKLMISKECGLRPIEIHNLKTKDIDLDKKQIHPTTAKHGANRILKISEKLRNSLADYINRKKLNPNDKLFKGTPEQYGKAYRTMRNNLSKKLDDPTIKSIRLYDLRHFYATTLYHKTRDILLEQKMGHKKIETTLNYTQLLNMNEEDEWTCKTATNTKEAVELIEAGFEYVTEIDGTKLFKKRK